MKVYIYIALLFQILLFTGCTSQKEGIQSFNEGMIFLKNKQYDKALESFDNSCKNNIAVGCFNKGWILENEKSNFLTRWWYGNSIYESYQRSCDLGFKKGCQSANRWKDYESGSDFIGYIIFFGILFFIFMMFNGNRKDNSKYNDFVDIAGGADPSDFHSSL